MRRAWSFVVAIVLFGLMGYNLVAGRPILDINIVAAGTALIAITLSWWFETAERR
jgi:uncharacterized membrane protein